MSETKQIFLVDLTRNVDKADYGEFLNELVEPIRSGIYEFIQRFDLELRLEEHLYSYLNAMLDRLYEVQFTLRKGLMPAV